jgi:uncharacterized SAM-binding protein YcdF (DUF218 family)
MNSPSFSLRLFRCFAGALGLFALVNAAREIASPGFSVAYILFYVPGSKAGADACLALLALLLGVSAFGPVRRRGVAVGLGLGLAALAALALLNAAEFYRLVGAGVLSTAWPVPLSIPLAVYIGLHVALCLRPRHLGEEPAQTGVLARVSAFALAGALASLWLGVVFYVHSLGLTDYRRRADAIVVLGARVYADGTPSEALAERVLTGAALYRQGLAPRLIVSGGTGESGHSEARVMRAVAMRAGVPAEAIIEDPLGVSTEATADNLEAIARRSGIRSVLAVSHYHHLPRIKLLFTRRGLPCFTVRADEGETLLRGTPYYVLRETAALSWAFLKG